MKRIIITLFTFALIFIAYDSFTKVNGPGGGYSNDPNGTSTKNCTSCHTGSLITSGSAHKNIKLTSNFTGGGYINDSVYSITISYDQAGISRWGFQTTVLDANEKMAGTLASAGSRTQKTTALKREYIEHTGTGTNSTSTNKTFWTFKWTAPSSNLDTVTFYVVVNAANSNKTTSGDQIYAKTFKIPPSSLLPVVTMSASDTSVCGGTAISFKSSATNKPTSYNWTFKGGAPSASTKQNPVVTYNIKGVHDAILEVKNAKGKSIKDTIEIEVRASPTAYIGGPAIRRFCKGDSVEIVANYNPKQSYKWSDGTIGHRIWAKDTGVYFVVASESGCSKTSNSIQVNHYPNASVKLTSDAINNLSCGNNKVKFTATSGFDSFYLYKNFNYVQTFDTNVFSQVVTNTADYNVKVYDGNGCISDFGDTLSLNVLKQLEAPIASCKEATHSSITFEWTYNGIPKGYQVSIDTGKTWAIPSTGTLGKLHKLSGLAPQKEYMLSVRATGNAPCLNGKIASIICKTRSCKGLGLKIDYDSVVCKNDPVIVTIHGLKGQRYSLSFDNNPPFTDSSFSFSPAVSMIYTVLVTDSNALGCVPEELNMNVKVDSIKNLVLLTQSATHHICFDDTIQFRASQGNDNYKFYINNLLKANSTDSIYQEEQYKTGDSAWVIATKGVCVSESEKIGIQVLPESDPGFTFTNLGSIYTFKPNIKSYQSYLWDFGDGSTSSIDIISHDYIASEELTVNIKLTIVDNNGCSSDTIIELKLPKFSGIYSIGRTSTIEIYPNPADNQVRIRVKGTSLVGSTLAIQGSDGKLISTNRFDSNDIVFSIRDMESGMYFVELVTKNNTVYRKRLMIK
jgi:PKD repeat protein